MQINIKCDKIINLNGINNIELVEGTNQWYWATDYCSGDLYEAECKCQALFYIVR